MPSHTSEFQSSSSPPRTVAEMMPLDLRRAEFEERLRDYERFRGKDPSAALKALGTFGVWAIEPLRAALTHKNEQARLAAVEALGEIEDPAAHPAIEAALDNSVGKVRAAALRIWSARHGRAIYPLLLERLKDPDEGVRAAAAEALGELGDETTVAPLCEALHACFVCHSAQRQRLIGIAVVLAIIMVYLGFFVGAAFLKIGGALGGLGGMWGSVISAHQKKRRARSLACRAITEALAKIADRSPTPALRQVLPELRVVAQDSLQMEKAARDVSRQTAAKIERLTAELKSLPLPSTAQSPAAESLPRPAGAPPD